MNGHDELKSLLGAYALDAVDDEERRAVDEHLARRDECRAEVAEHLEVAASLGTTAAAVAPDELWAAVLDHIEGDPVDVARVPPVLGDSVTPPPDRPVPITGPTPSAEVVPLDRHRRRRAGLIASLAVAAAVIAVLAIGVVQLSRHNAELEDLIAQQPPAASVDDLAEAALQDPSSRVFELTSDTDDATATAVVTPAGDGYLVSSTLEPLPPDRTYQLWNIGDAGPVSLGVLGNDPGAAAFHVQGPLATLAITAEQAGGVPAPENIPLVTSTA